tara:strand:+ start:6088 stop:6396 length:309 start_codon:yes stop_codon:yes gene_type:complete
MFEYPSNCGLTATGPASWNFIGVVGEAGCGTVGTAESIGFKDRGATAVVIGKFGKVSTAGATGATGAVVGITGGAIGLPIIEGFPTGALGIGRRAGIAACIN